MPKRMAEKNPILSALAVASKAAPEQIQPEDAKEVQTEEYDDQTCHNIHSGLILPEETAHCSCQCTEDEKNHCKPGDKAQRGFNGFSRASLTTPRKIGNVDRKHRKQAGG